MAYKALLYLDTLPCNPTVQTPPLPLSSHFCSGRYWPPCCRSVMPSTPSCLCMSCSLSLEHSSPRICLAYSSVSWSLCSDVISSSRPPPQTGTDRTPPSLLPCPLAQLRYPPMHLTCRLSSLFILSSLIIMSLMRAETFVCLVHFCVSGT